ncbi:MAG: hypothetical protein WBB05_25135 [Mycolicibacterium fortuitum]
MNYLQVRIIEREAMGIYHFPRAMNRRAVSALLAASTSLLVLLYSIVCAPSATADPNPVKHRFLKSSQDPWVHSNAIGTFTGQVDWSQSGRKTLAWRLQMQPEAASVVFGNSMTCNSWVGGTNWTDYHANIEPSYVLHASIPNLRDDGYLYEFRSICRFKVLTDAGLVDGTWETSVNFRIGTND